MPEAHNKHGPPELWATIRCLVPECGTERLIWPEQAERLARRLEAGLGMRYMIGRLKCRKCGWKNASLSFHIAHRIRPWEKRKLARFPHQRDSETTTAATKGDDL